MAPSKLQLSRTRIKQSLSGSGSTINTDDITPAGKVRKQHAYRTSLNQHSMASSVIRSFAEVHTLSECCLA